MPNYRVTWQVEVTARDEMAAVVAADQKREVGDCKVEEISEDEAKGWVFVTSGGSSWVGACPSLLDALELFEIGGYNRSTIVAACHNLHARKFIETHKERYAEYARQYRLRKREEVQTDG